MEDGPPSLRFISEVSAAIYYLQTKQVYTGSRDDLHPWIAKRHGVDYDPNFPVQCYISGEVFALRVIPYQKVLIIDTLLNLKPEDLTAILSLGYLLMGPDYSWLVFDDKMSITEIPSALTSSFYPKIK